jgi:N-acetylglucosamine-6-sulfatase
MQRSKIVPVIAIVAIVMTTSFDAVGGGSQPRGTGEPAAGSHPEQQTRAQPNIVLILTDDQRFDELRHLPAIGSKLVGRGMNLRRAFVVNSLCCPSRATILTGTYSHTTGIYLNGDGGAGGFPDFRDGSTIATWLRDAGYRTGLFGKYLNHYESARYIPPGWTHWRGLVGPNSAYYDYDVSIHGRRVHHGSRPRDYATDVFGSMTAHWIRTVPASAPLFAYYAPPAPHGPYTPPRRYLTTSVGSMPHYRSFNEADVSDKPGWIRTRPRLGSSGVQAAQTSWTLQHRTLLAVDDAVRRIVRALADTGRLHNTLLVFTSDNGLSLGEHRLHYKMNAFEESIRVPMVVRWDGRIPAGTVSRHLATNMDLAPTFVAAAGAAAPAGVEGRSLLPLLGNDRVVRRSFLIEHKHSWLPEDPPTYCAIRTTRWKLVHNVGDRGELYNLARDPWELRNLIGRRGARRIHRVLLRRLRRLCDPRPPGMPDF